MPDIEPVIIGRFGKTFGIKGWITLQSFTEPAENMLNYKPWYIETHQGWQPIKISQHELKGQTIIVKIEGCDTPEAAKLYTHYQIAVDRSKLPELPEETHYWADLEGMTVINTQGVTLGKVDGLFETGANQVMIVKNGQERLLPYIADVIKHVDKVNKVITVEWDPEF